MIWIIVSALLCVLAEPLWIWGRGHAGMYMIACALCWGSTLAYACAMWRGMPLLRGAILWDAVLLLAAIPISWVCDQPPDTRSVIAAALVLCAIAIQQ